MSNIRKQRAFGPKIALHLKKQKSKGQLGVGHVAADTSEKMIQEVQFE